MPDGGTVNVVAGVGSVPDGDGPDGTGDGVAGSGAEGSAAAGCGASGDGDGVGVALSGALDGDVLSVGDGVGELPPSDGDGIGAGGV